MVKDSGKKNPTVIAFFKLFLHDVKLEVLLILRHFFGSFLDAPLTRPFIFTPIYTQMQAAEVFHISCKFYSHLNCNSQKKKRKEKKTRKADFVVFLVFFDHAFLRPQVDAPIFLPNERSHGVT